MSSAWWVLSGVLTLAAEPPAVPLQLVTANCHDLELEPLPGGGWSIRTTGADPYVFTAPVDQVVDIAVQVLAFDYFSTTGTDAFQAFVHPPLAEASSVKGPGLARSEGWSSHALDLAPLLGNRAAPVGGLRLDFGNAAGKTLQLRNLRLRAPNQRERELAATAAARRQRLVVLDRFLNDYQARTWPCRLTRVAVGAETITVSGQLGARRAVRLVEAPLSQDLDLGLPWASQQPVQPAADGTFEITVPRRIADRDRLLSRWALVAAANDELLAAARYAESVAPRWDLPAPQPRGRKGLGGFHLAHPTSDLTDLGIGYATVNLVLNGVFSTTPAPGWSPFTYAGQTWYVHDEQVQRFDETFRTLAEHGVIVSLIVLLGQPGNSPAGSYSRLVAHPAADPAGIFVMPDVTSAAGLTAYAAGLDYLARRYSDPQAGHGRIHHWILHNEVNAGWVWTNAGEQSAAVYLEWYQRSLRTAWLIARQYDPHARVYISLEHHWTMRQDPRSHPGRELLTRLVRTGQVEGDFEWGVAFHPYPQNLFEPRVWEDNQVTFDFETPKITFRNLEVLDAWARQPAQAYRGRPRSVHLSEQGLNSRDYSAAALRDQAAGMAYTWAKLAPLSTIEAFQYHNWVDNRHEGGLRIGLRRFPDDADEPLGRKPIWYVYQALDTPQQAAVTAPYLPVVGLTSWDQAVYRGALP
ncbi:MAG: hypothetical protein IT204_17985 [Fimbriimonadaceae bacterium]|nr:hypothetical protein [Fimbriimonadaceae bacterium]